MRNYRRKIVWGAMYWMVMQTSALWAQEAPVSNAELQRQVQELRAMVEKLSKASQPPSAAPAPQEATGFTGLQPSQVVPASNAWQASPNPQGNPEPIPAPTGSPSTNGAANGFGQFQMGYPEGGAPAPREQGDVSGFASGVPGSPNIFILHSADNSNKLAFTGQIQADNHTFLNRKDTSDQDTFFLRRARFGLEATMFDYYEFRFMPDFGKGTATIADAYLNIHYIDAFQFTIGKYKDPVSYEEMVMDRFVPLVERSIIDQIMPLRNPGMMIHGEKVLGDRLDYALSLSNGGLNGVTTTATGTSQDLDADGNFDISFRIVARPFRGLIDCGDGLLENLQFGLSGSSGIAEGEMNPLTLKTSGGVPWFAFNNSSSTAYTTKLTTTTAVVGGKTVITSVSAKTTAATTTTIVQQDGWRTRIVPELAYFYGPFGFSAQYLHEDQEMLPSATTSPHGKANVVMDGYNCMLTCLLTGETRTTYNQYIIPLRPINPLNSIRNIGAWELVAAASRLDLSQNVFATGSENLANASLYSRGCTELTFGYNWYLNQWVRMQFNWEHAMFDTPVTLGTGKLSTQDTLLSRFQIVF